MKEIKRTLAIVMIMMIALQASAQLQKENLYLPLTDNSQKVKPGFVTGHKKIRLYYIKAKPSLAGALKDIGNYTTLEQAIKSSKIKVQEIISQGTGQKTSKNNQGPCFLSP